LPVALQRISVELADAIVGGDLSRVEAGEGWPHADTLDGLGMVVQHGAPLWLVTLDGVVIGDCGTFGPPDSDGCVEIGYGLAAPYRGRGHGSELVAALAQIVLAQPGVRRVGAKVLLDNTPSRGALERAGFTVERTGDEYVWYSLLGQR
jgi:RimJ/RimL family protein N-acetyltransferase